MVLVAADAIACGRHRMRYSVPVHGITGTPDQTIRLRKRCVAEGEVVD